MNIYFIYLFENSIRFMGYKKGCLWLWWIVDILLGDSEFSILTSFLLLSPFFCCLLFIRRSCKKIKDRQKNIGKTLDLNYFGVYDYFLVWDIFWTSRKSHDSSRQGFEVYYRIVFGNYKFEGMSCLQWVYLSEAVTSKRDTSPWLVGD